MIGAFALAACQGSSNVGGAPGGGTGGTGGAGGAGGEAPLRKADKVDILFAIDNSGSMADKQAVLALALSDLVLALVNPPCLDQDDQLAPEQPASAAEPCLSGYSRQYAPVEDIHLGVISSSLGAYGADACSVSAPEVTNNDHGHLLARTAPGGATIPTYEGKGFLAWDPGARYSPPGDSDPVAMVTTFKEMVLGVGQSGCGFEGQLESWYRFLADPEPYASISLQDGEATPQGIDSVLLAQRADFLRPDSMLAIIMLSDENDCSIRAEGQYFYVAQQNAGAGKFHLPRPRSECATDPNDPCCLSCGQTKPAECPDDPTCFNPDGSIAVLSDIEDSTGLRCYDQKRRFGIDFLYPIGRYVQALTSSTVTNRAGELIPNPIFSDLNPDDANTTIRDPGLVVLTAIVGVPWQDLARDPANLALGLKSAAELEASGAWDVILGDPASYVPPGDPFMIESPDPRSGPNPITGDSISPPGSASNAINGSEYTNAERKELQYACAFTLLQPRDCSVPGTLACECEPGTDNPLCAPNPDDGGESTLQVRAKAHPGLRHLSVLKGIGGQGVAASICPAQVTDPASGDFAYRPAIRTLLERMATRL
ncbi:MAG: hypothetical protein IT372_10410 [Polyangiaceae bacterium]|nr:hypothetical protein [Polyangiaceae bacterium]